MQVSDFISDFFSKKKIKYVLCCYGRGIFIFNSFSSKNKKIKVIFPIHEQTCAMAADAYARISKNIGAAFATSGPGATNLATGICGAYFDSVPVLYITGQVIKKQRHNRCTTNWISRNGDCVGMYKYVTKYAYKIRSAKEN